MRLRAGVCELRHSAREVFYPVNPLGEIPEGGPALRNFP